jgi:signal transduction histidine kinase
MIPESSASVITFVYTAHTPELAKTVIDGALDAEVLGDRALLERAFDNLIDNAFAAGAHAVRIDARIVGATLKISVEDDGPGVPPELRARIFEPGYSRHGSTGLGLGFVAEVLRAHRGAIACENGSCGARFVLRMPLPAACAEA